MPTVIRPTWIPANNEQRRLLAEARRKAAIAKRAEEEMWAAILTARNADVPDTVLCEETDQSRATLNRRYGARSARSTGRDMPRSEP